jgi:alpha-beta hydrolase superfamily lysophospholipase
MTATVAAEGPTAASWAEPDGVAPRGTLIVLPGRGEAPELYQRFGRRIAADGYRVHVVSDPAADPALATAQVLAVAAEVRPYVLVGSDTGALFAVGLITSGQVADVDAVVLAGLPSDREADQAALRSGPARAEAADGGRPGDSWEAELAARTACPTHRGRLAGAGLRRGALFEPIPAGWESLADLGRLTVPALGLHGTADPVSPLEAARERYRQTPRAELISIAGGVHDVLNDVNHRTVAATIVLFLERLRLGADLPPIAVSEKL